MTRDFWFTLAIGIIIIIVIKLIYGSEIAGLFTVVITLSLFIISGYLIFHKKRR